MDDVRINKKQIKNIEKNKKKQEQKIIKKNSKK